MTNEAIREKIRKLFALAGNNPNEHEAAVALKKAHDLMLEYGIDEVGEEGTSIDVITGQWHGLKILPWHFVLIGAIGRLYDCSGIRGGKKDKYQFVGMPHKVEAAEETFLYVVAQIEVLYKTALKAYSGSLTKAGRAELRASFKDAAAAKVSQRISQILAQRQVSSKALMVIDTGKEKIDEILEERGIKTRTITLRQGFGSGTGYNAGDHVRIQGQMK